MSRGFVPFAVSMLWLCAPLTPTGASASTVSRTESSCRKAILLTEKASSVLHHRSLRANSLGCESLSALCRTGQQERSTDGQRSKGQRLPCKGLNERAVLAHLCFFYLSIFELFWISKFRHQNNVCLTLLGRKICAVHVDFSSAAYIVPVDIQMQQTFCFA